MGWLSWVLLVACLIGVFVVWDLVFCVRQYCRRLFDRG